LNKLIGSRLIKRRLLFGFLYLLLLLDDIEATKHLFLGIVNRKFRFFLWPTKLRYIIVLLANSIN